jgi:putative ABC transport system substrate-binding protein
VDHRQAARVRSLREGLQELGHSEGQTYTIEERSAEGKLERLPELAADLAQSRVDLIVSYSQGARAAKEVAPTIPLVFFAVDPVAEGLVASFSRPGGNMTGFAFPWKDLASKWAELLRDTFPGIRRVAYLFINPQTPQLPWFQAAAAVLKLDVLPLRVHGEADLEAAFAAAARQRAQAIIEAPSPFFEGQRPRMIALATRYRLAALYYQRVFVDAGGLMSYGPDVRLIWRRAAVYVDRILKGTRPGDLPIEQPTRYELVINLKTAKALDLTIPQSVLLRADGIIQ